MVSEEEKFAAAGIFLVKVRVEKRNQSWRDFPAASLLSVVSDKTLSTRLLLSTQHIYTLATAEEKGHKGEKFFH